MADADLDVPVDASAATDRDSWLELIAEIAKEEGSFQTLGPCHWALMVEDGRTLAVSFETIYTARARQGQMPLLHHIAAEMGWSHLCLIAEGPTWFRDPAIYAYFDRLVDETFFEGFDRVLFYGAGPMGHAACAFSVAAPGAQVLALSPPATLDPAQTRWDDRHKSFRRLDFTSRYGYAPDMIEGCAALTLICDPYQRADSMHAALFHTPHTLHLNARFAGSDLETVFARLGILDQLIIEAAEQRLSIASFASAWRKRRNDSSYLKALLFATEVTGKTARVIMLCRNVVERLRISRFRKRLLDLTDQTKAPNET